MTRIAIALVHHPCVDKNGDVYTTSITNLDVHDIARSSRTFGVDTYYIVTPILAQQELAQTIATFWDEGPGRDRNPDRQEALRTLQVVASLEEAMERESRLLGESPVVLATSARETVDAISFADARAHIAKRAGTLVIFGTGHGLAAAALDTADYVVEPLRGRRDDYNHLSVRSAAAIILDRLLSTSR